jgi:uncharacterized protein
VFLTQVRSEKGRSVAAMSDDAGVKARLRDALRVAVKARDKVATSALRSTLGLLDNADAADLAEAPPMEAGRIAGGVHGLGAGEVARRELSEEQLVAIAREELARWQTLASDYEGAGQTEHAARLRAEVATVAAVLDRD